MKESTHYLLKGYPGLEAMAEQISQYFPNSKSHIEPFAGLGRTVPFVKDKEVILNDLSEYAINYLVDTFPNAKLITKQDFREVIKRYRKDPDAFLFLDPPWRKNIYKNNSGPVFTLKTPSDYYAHIFYWLNKEDTVCKWMLCSDRDRHELSKFVKGVGYYEKELEHPTKKLYNRPIAVKLIANFTLEGESKT